MNWLNKIVDELLENKPSGEILISSGGSPSGEYHLGHLRELVICDAILLEIHRRGRKAQHLYFVDDLDALRKVPVNIPEDYQKYLGRSLCDIPAPDKSDQSYADYFIQGLERGCRSLGIEVEFVRSHNKYRKGFFTSAIEQSLKNITEIKLLLESISRRKLGEEWSPIQINESGYLKKRQFISINTEDKSLVYLDKNGDSQSINYDSGDVKLDWRIDWPARWALLGVDVEPFGRDHASAGGSYDTGEAIVKTVFNADPPLPVRYDFINLFGDTKKMSASKGTGLSASEAASIVPPEVLRYFIFNAPPNKLLHFDPVSGLIRLVDEYAVLLAKSNKNDSEKQLIDLCIKTLKVQSISRIPFSHLVESYQAALRDEKKTIDIISRTEHSGTVVQDEKLIKTELKFITTWLDKWAPDDVKFELLETVKKDNFTDEQLQFMNDLAVNIESLPEGVSGEKLHKTIYEFTENTEMSAKELFTTLYQVTIGQTHGPRAGWFLSILPREWLVERLKLIR